MIDDSGHNRSKMASARVVRKWEKPPTSVYENNYGFGINYYQPMIDYINAKEQGLSPTKPHLPWTNERALSPYRPGNLVRCYSSEDVQKLTQQTAERAKEDLSQFKIAKRSGFSVCKVASAARVQKHVRIESAADNTQKKIQQRQSKAAELETRKKMCDMKAEIEKMQEATVEAALSSAAKFLRGKSAKAIEATLLSESIKNISSSTEMDIKTFQRNQMINSHDSRAHAKLMHERTCQIDDSFSQPLNKLKDELKSFDSKNSNYFIDKRWFSLLVL